MNIEIEGDQLTVSGERKLENEDRRDGYHRIEVTAGGGERTISANAGSQPAREAPRAQA